MSGIFNLFGATNAAPINHQRTGFGETPGSFPMKANVMGSGSGRLKQESISKPKGLSLRSKNDLNVCTPSQKTPLLAKAKLSTLDCAMRPSTPRQKETVSKLQIVREKQLKSLSPTSKSPFFNFTISQKGSDDILFKKPVTPKRKDRTRRLYPEPECLPRDMPDNDFWDLDLDNEISELKKSLKTKYVVPFTDEGFESDPELIPTPPMSPVEWDQDNNTSIMSDLVLEAPEWPSLSDSDDDLSLEDIIQ